MDAIDRLGWAAGMSVRSYGLRIGLRANQPDVLPRIAATLPPGAAPIAPGPVQQLYSVRVGPPGPARVRSYHLVYSGAERIARTLDLDDALDALEADLRLFVAAWARNRVFVHAGVVGWKGRAIVVPGRTFSGKSTLVAALVRAGATYYSDEYAVLDPLGRVHPYPKAIALREGAGRATKHALSALGWSPGVEPLPIGLVLSTRHRPGARWRPREITAGQAALALLDNTVPARRAPARVLATLRQAAASARALRGQRGEAAAVAETILRCSEA